MGSRFYGRTSVIKTRQKQQRTGDVKAATLRVRGTADNKTNVAYSYCYVWPQSEQTGLGSGSAASVQANITLYREGESSGPRADDVIRVGGIDYLVTGVNTRLDADIDDGYAVYDCDVTPGVGGGL